MSLKDLALLSERCKNTLQPTKADCRMKDVFNITSL